MDEKKPTARMRPETTTDDYRNALMGSDEFGSLGYDWDDKPHRLVYDLCGEVDHLRQQLESIKKTTYALRMMVELIQERAEES